MSKTITTIIIVVAAIALVAIGQPHLAFILGNTAFAATAAGVIIHVAVGLALASLSALVAGKPKVLSQSLFDRLNLTVDPTAPRKIVFGKTAAGADVRYHETGPATSNGGLGISGKGTWLYQVVALASHKLNSVQSVYLEDVLCYSGGASTGTYASQNALAIKAITEGSTANATALASGSYWTATAKFTGCAYLIIAMKDDANVYANGVPTRITTIVEGSPVYDPRLDSTVGGSGSMRATDQSTWAYYNGSDEIGRNSALCLLTFLLGYRINGVLAWGMGIPPTRIDLSNFITYANVCDEAVTAKAGGTVKRYQCDGTFSTADSFQTVIDSITASMGTAKLLDTGGLYQLIGGYNDLASPVVDFGADDLVGQYQWKPAPPSRDRHNVARGRFADPSNLYQLNDWPEVSTGTLADGIPRVLPLDFNCISRAETCQRVAKMTLAREAFPGLFVGTFMPKAFAVQVGSLVHLSLPSEGWNQKLFRVIQQGESADLLFQMTLAEEDASIYTWTSSEAVDLPAVIHPPAYDPLAVESVVGLAATGRTITNSTGGKDSFIDIAWTGPNTNPRTIQIESKETAGTVWSSETDRTDATALSFTFRAPSSGLSTDIRARYRMQSGVYGPWATTTVTAATGTAASAVVGYLTNESVTFAADNAGNIL